MKVLIVFAHPAPYKVNLFNALAKHLDLHVVFEREIQSYRSMHFYQSQPVSFHQIPIKGMNLGKENHLSFDIIKHLKKNQYDLIVMNGYSSLTEMVTIHYLINHRIPYVLYVNGGVIRKDAWWKKQLKKHFISHAKAYLSPTPIVDSYLVHYGANPLHIHHYPYATIYEHEVLKKPLSSKDKQVIRDRYHLPEGPLFVSVGQLIKRKNFDQLITLWKQNPNSYHLVLIGDGPEKKNLQRQIKQLGITTVHWIPFLPKAELLSCLSAMDCFILLSKEDIYGHVINEAHSQGLPVIASEHIISGKNLIQEGHNGFVVPLMNEHILPKLKEALQMDAFESATNSAKQNTYERTAESHLKIFKALYHG